MRGNGHRIVGLAIAFGLVAATSRTLLADEWRVSVRGGEIGAGETPLVSEAPGVIPQGVYDLHSGSGPARASAQVFDQGEKRYLAFVMPEIAASPQTDLFLEARAGLVADVANGLSVRSEGVNLVIDLDQKRLTDYRVDSGSKPILFPLIGPTGDSYTRAFPMQSISSEDHDHPHQRSCWFTHGKVNGIDFWSEGGKSGKIKETHRVVIASGPVLARIATRNDWVGPDGTRVCSDERIVTFYRTLQSRIIDFEFTIRASDGPVTFGDTKEGMFGVRVASSMDVTRKLGGRITNAEGYTDEKAWGKSSPWVDYVGPVNQKTVGIAILNHPASFRYPTTWHVRTYGLFAANPFGWHDFGGPAPGDHTIPTGGNIAFGYRVILHDGDTKSARIDRAFAAYAKPASVTISKK